MIGHWLGRALLPAAAVLYGALLLGTVNAIGLVGEVAIGWSSSPPVVQVEVGAPPPEVALGPLHGRRTRPIASLDLGELSLPLAINTYTGGLPDWPAALVTALSGDGRAARWVHGGLGLLLLVLAHRFLRFHASALAGGLAALFLATDWCFLFYRKALGGTEILLQAAGLLLVWALWSRRWRGGVHGTVAIALGVGLGMLAKATFLATILAVGLAALLTRWDQASGRRPPPAVRPGLLLLLPVLCVSPLLIANLLQLSLPGPAPVSHDMLGLQLARLGSSTPRESLANLGFFFGNPLAFFAVAYKAAPVVSAAPLRALGFGLTLLGVALEWRDRRPAPASALLRFLSIVVPLQILFLFLLNRDLHHLAQSTVLLALLVGLAAARLGATVGPPQSAARLLVSLIVLAPHLIAGVQHLRRTDAVLATIAVPTFTATGQQELTALLQRNGVERLVTADYEIYGLIEVLAPEIQVTHTWAALSRRAADVPVAPDAILRAAAGGHLLIVRPSTPMIYNWTPTFNELRQQVPADLSVERIDSLSDGRKNVAELYRVERQRAE